MNKISYTVEDFAKEFVEEWYEAFDDKSKKRIDYELGCLQFGDIPDFIIKLYELFKRREERNLFGRELYNELKKSEKFKNKVNITDEELLALLDENYAIGNFKKS